MKISTSMKIVTKFAFAALVACVVAIGGAKANAQTCDPACVSCMQGCGANEAGCFEACGGTGGVECWDACIAEAQTCETACYLL
jgi:hypothetical protein